MEREGQARDWVQRACTWWGATPTSPATSSVEILEPAGVPAGGGPGLPDAGPRSAHAQSGGEAQRIRLAAQLGSNLQGVCYVLDEPTIGLHPRDNQHPAQGALATLWATRATRWSWSSTTKTPSAAPTTSSTSAPAPASAAADWWPRAACRATGGCSPNRRRAGMLAHPLIHPLQARRAHRRHGCPQACKVLGRRASQPQGTVTVRRCRFTAWWQ